MVALLIGVFVTNQFLEIKQAGFDETISGVNEGDQGNAELTEGKSQLPYPPEWRWSGVSRELL